MERDWSMSTDEERERLMILTLVELVQDVESSLSAYVLPLLDRFAVDFEMLLEIGIAPTQVQERVLAYTYISLNHKRGLPLLLRFRRT